MLDVTIVIVSFNTREILRRCLQSVLEHSGEMAYEIIVVDNASGDQSAAMVAAEFPQVRLIANPRNLMFAAASNQGMAVAAGRHLLLLNSAAFLRAGALVTLVRSLDARPRAAAVGPKVLNTDGSLQSKGFTSPRIGLGLMRVTGLNKLLPERLKRRWFASYFWDENTAVMPDVLSGCCMLLKASVVRDSVRAWETSFGVGYGIFAESLTTTYNAQRLAAAWLAGRDAQARLAIRHEVRMGAWRIRALASRWWAGRGAGAPTAP